MTFANWWKRASGDITEILAGIGAGILLGLFTVGLVAGGLFAVATR